MVVGDRRPRDPVRGEALAVLGADAVGAALRPAGLVEQLVREVLVEGPALLQALVVAGRGGAEDAPRARELAEEDLVHGCIDVDRAGERLAHLPVGEHSVALVQEERVRQAGHLGRLHGRLALEPRHQVRGGSWEARSISPDATDPLRTDASGRICTRSVLNAGAFIPSGAQAYFVLRV